MMTIMTSVGNVIAIKIKKTIIATPRHQLTSAATLKYLLVPHNAYINHLFEYLPAYIQSTTAAQYI